ncbi:MAG: glycosyltransferase, partial [Crocinitomicaceae bacterium]|nr:glycosyltransferase [Crocinitomicaceae bacterium]
MFKNGRKEKDFFHCLQLEIDSSALKRHYERYLLLLKSGTFAALINFTGHLNSRRLHILFLASWYPSRTHNTLGNFIQHHAEAIATRHDVHVLYITPLEGADQTFIQDETIAGVKTTIVYYQKGAFHLLRRFIAFKKGILHLQENGLFHFDIAHLNVIWPQGWQAIYLRWKYGLRYIITEHWTGYDLTVRPHPGKMVAHLSKLTTKNAEVVCPVTDNLGSTMRAFGLSGHYVTVPNVVDTNIFHIEEKSSSPIRFIHVSSLNEKQKNITGILRAWKKATDTNHAIHLHIGGDGPVNMVSEEAVKLKIPSESISFFGEQTWDFIAKKMTASHCLLLFSNYENLPCVIAEALASGIPVISTATGGIGEHISEDRGVLVQKC